MPLNKITTSIVFAVLLILIPNLLCATPRDVSYSTSGEQRIEYLKKLLKSRSGDRLAMHNHGQTKEKIDQMLDQAKAEAAVGNDKKAAEISKEAFKIFVSALESLPDEPEKAVRFRNRYEDMRRGLEKFITAQKENKERFSEEQNSTKEYSKADVSKQLKQADAAATRGDYEAAIGFLRKAQSIVTSSLQGILNDKQLVVEFDISTPEKEYQYELRRYHGYEGLVAIAIEVKKPNAVIKDAMLELDSKAKWMAEEAQYKASKSNYPIAIRMMMDATDVVRKALKLVGAAI